LIFILNVKNHSTISCTFIYISFLKYTHLWLHVKDKANVESSIEAYFEEELLNGDNQLIIDKYRDKKFDAVKGLRINSLPPILYINIAKIYYDFIDDKRGKYEHRYEFSEKLSLDKYLTGNNTYYLYGVLVHTGSTKGGAHRAYFKIDDKWIACDDWNVNEVTPKESIEEQFGGSTNHSTSAFALIYIRDSAYNTLMTPVKHEEIPRQLITYFDALLDKTLWPLR